MYNRSGARVTIERIQEMYEIMASEMVDPAEIAAAWKRSPEVQHRRQIRTELSEIGLGDPPS